MNLSGPGGIQNIPEFHDCQRFLVARDDGGLEFGEVYAVFAVFDQAYNQQTGEGRFQIFAPGSHKDSALAAAQIWAGSSYAPLHLAPGYNCLYVYWGPGGGSPPLKGRVVGMGPDPSGCNSTMSKAALLAASGGEDEWYDLAVIRSPAPGDSPHALPQPSARWEWHDELRIQYIGLTCGSAWCEVGPPSLTPASPHPTKPGGPDPNSKVVKVKGWYDRQYLAKPPDGSQGLPSPTGILGTIIPAENLGDFGSASDFAGKWVRAAYVHLDQQTGENPYRVKLYLSKPGAANYNVVSLCQGDRTACIPPTVSPTRTLDACRDANATWWARIVRADDGDSLFTCVKRCDVPNERIPATVRWRWLRNDETMWIRCATGCCEVIFPGGT